MSEKLCPVCIELGFCQLKSTVQSLGELGIQDIAQIFPNLSGCPAQPPIQTETHTINSKTPDAARNTAGILFPRIPDDDEGSDISDDDSWDNRI